MSALGVALAFFTFICGVITERILRDSSLIMDATNRVTKIRGKWYRLRPLPEPIEDTREAEYYEDGGKI